MGPARDPFSTHSQYSTSNTSDKEISRLFSDVYSSMKIEIPENIRWPRSSLIRGAKYVLLRGCPAPLRDRLSPLSEERIRRASMLPAVALHPTPHRHHREAQWAGDRPLRGRVPAQHTGGYPPASSRQQRQPWKSRRQTSRSPTRLYEVLQGLAFPLAHAQLSTRRLRKGAGEWHHQQPGRGGISTSLLEDQFRSAR